MKNVRWFAMLLFACCMLKTANAQGGRRFVTVDFPTAVSYTAPLGINNFGDVAGFYDDTYGLIHGYVRINGKFEKVDFPGGFMTACAGINDLGLVCGTYFDLVGFQHGFEWYRGKFRQLDVPYAVANPDRTVFYEFGPGLGTGAYGLNLLGNAVGQYADKNGTSHGWVLDDGHYTTVDAPGAGTAPGNGTTLFSINLWGDVVGSYHSDTPPFVHGFVLSCGRYTHIDFPGASPAFGTQSNGINDLGEVVGAFLDTNFILHGMLVRNGRYTQIDFPGAVNSECHTINDLGDVTGLYEAPDGKSHGFIMSNR